MSDKDKINQIMKSDKPLNWLFTGDSITHGALHTYGWRSFPEHFSERIRMELGRNLDYILNMGISGYTIDCVLENFERWDSFFKPDVVFLMIGTNDSQLGKAGLEAYEANLLKMIDVIRQNKSMPIINTPNPIITAVGAGLVRTCLHEYVEVMRRVSQHKNAILIDHWIHWETAKPDSDSMMEWLSDSLHPNCYGHIEMAKEIFRSLNIYDVNSKVCGLFVP